MLVSLRLHCARGAARTSDLSRTWRGVWTQLRYLTFDGDVDLDRLCIHLPGNLKLGDARISSLLDAADKLAPLELVVNHGSFVRAPCLPCRVPLNEYCLSYCHTDADAVLVSGECSGGLCSLQQMRRHKKKLGLGPRRSQRLGKPNPRYFSDDWVQV